jgi:hypothetical protein
MCGAIKIRVSSNRWSIVDGDSRKVTCGDISSFFWTNWRSLGGMPLPAIVRGIGGDEDDALITIGYVSRRKYQIASPL